MICGAKYVRPAVGLGQILEINLFKIVGVGKILIRAKALLDPMKDSNKFWSQCYNSDGKENKMWGRIC